MNNCFYYDVVVIGGGHAGSEAALAAARVGAKTILLTMNMDHIAQMSCNPAIGGIAKGQVVREIDALGGAMGRVTDAASIQFRMLNRKKGPAVWSPRSQCDKVCYQKSMKRELELQENLSIHQAEGLTLEIEKNKITAVLTQFGDKFVGKSFVICSGTFLTGRLHYGSANFAGGRAGDPASNQLAIDLKSKLNLRIGRLKTGTPARILAKSIDFSKMEKQDAERPDEMFSYYQDEIAYPRATEREMPCYLVNTVEETADVVKANIHRSPLYGGEISGIGTRYCPSFEDKVVRFPHHKTHQLYLEPEGEFTEEYYINGISTSLPVDVQVKMLQSIPGMEKVVLSRYAYAIEYDFVIPDQIERSLRTKKWDNLYLAGQVNGTSGYEEAGGQGLIAGLNAARCAEGKDGIELGRETSYIGVMIDDLVTKDITEPYRLFTSRAEYRLRLRQDNADLRLSQLAIDSGILKSSQIEKFENYKKRLDKISDIVATTKHNGELLLATLAKMKGRLNENDKTLPTELLELDIKIPEDRKILNQLIINAHYKGYLEREDQAVKKLQKLEEWKVPTDFDYDALIGLRNEAKAKLKSVVPTTLAQAGRIDGVTPAEIALLQVHLKRQSGKK
jgi:tRNA uridine 5-carboxymethylaminomethyl modification enzyme